MPKDVEYHIGDSVQNENLGNAIILGTHIHAEKGLPVYHVYFFRDKLFRYAFPRHLTFVSAATPASIDEARNILLTASQSSQGSHPYTIGDVVYTPLSNVIILDNGHEKTNGRLYYHVACEKNESLHYMDSADIFHKVRSADDASIKKAKKILMDKVLLPAYSND